MFQPPSVEGIPTVQAMVAAMDRTVAGLEKVKLRLAVALRRHMVAAAEDWSVQPVNLLILGGSGSGKTYLLRAALEAAQCIWTEANATEYSDVGYQGRDLVSMYTGLVGPRWRGHRGTSERPHGKAEIVGMAERWGVVVIDEWDKLRSTGKRGEREVGRALQAELLKMAEGADIFVKGDDADRHGFVLRTHGILHIAVGAFQGLNGVVSDRLDLDAEDPRTPHLYQDAMVEDIISYGFLEELAGRFSTIIALPPLDNTMLGDILRHQLLPRYVSQLRLEGVELQVTEGAVHQLAAVGRTSKIGARALVPKIEKCLWEAWALARAGDAIVLDVDHVARETAEVVRVAAA